MAKVTFLGEGKEPRPSFAEVDRQAFEDPGSLLGSETLAQFTSPLVRSGVGSPLAGITGLFSPSLGEAINKEFARSFPQKEEDLSTAEKTLQLAGSGIGSAARTGAALAYPPLALPVLGSFAGEAFGQSLIETRNEDLTNIERAGVATANALAEFAFEGLALRFLPTQVKPLVLRALRSAFISGSEESLTEITQNAVANYYREQGLTEGSLEAAIAGAFGGTAISPFVHVSKGGIKLDTNETNTKEAIEDLETKREPPDSEKEVEGFFGLAEPQVYENPKDPKQELHNTMVALAQQGVKKSDILADAVLADRGGASAEQFNTILRKKYLHEEFKERVRQKSKEKADLYQGIYDDIQKNKFLNRNQVSKKYNIPKDEAARIMTLLKTTGDPLEAVKQELQESIQADFQLIPKYQKAVYQKDMENQIDFQISSLYAGVTNKFDQYNTDFIGHGEGGLAYGWGFYLTEGTIIAFDTYVQIAKTLNAEINAGGKAFVVKDVPSLRIIMKNAFSTLGIDRDSGEENWQTVRKQILPTVNLLAYGSDQEITEELIAEAIPTEENRAKIREFAEALNEAGDESTYKRGPGYMQYITLFKGTDLTIDDLIQNDKPINDNKPEVVQGIMRAIDKLIDKDDIPNLDNAKIRGQLTQGIHDLFFGARRLAASNSESFLRIMKKLGVTRDSDIQNFSRQIKGFLEETFFGVTFQADIISSLKERINKGDIIGRALGELVNESLNVSFKEGMESTDFIGRSVSGGLTEINFARDLVKISGIYNKSRSLNERLDSLSNLAKSLDKFQADLPVWTRKEIQKFLKNPKGKLKEKFNKTKEALGFRKPDSKNDEEMKRILKEALEGGSHYLLPRDSLFFNPKLDSWQAVRQELVRKLIFKIAGQSKGSPADYVEAHRRITRALVNEGVLGNYYESGQIGKKKDFKEKFFNIVFFRGEDATIEDTLEYQARQTPETRIDPDFLEGKIQNQEATPSGTRMVPNTDESVQLMAQHLLSTGLVNRIVYTNQQLYNQEGQPVNAFIDHATGDVFLSKEIQLNSLGHEGGHSLFRKIQRNNPEARIIRDIENQFNGDLEAFFDAVGDLYYDRVMPKGLRQMTSKLMVRLWDAGKQILGLRDSRDAIVEAFVDRMVNERGEWIKPQFEVRNEFREAVDTVFGETAELTPEVVKLANEVVRQYEKRDKNVEKWSDTETKGMELIKRPEDFRRAWNRFFHGLALSAHEQYAVHRVLNEKILEDLRRLSETGTKEFSNYLRAIEWTYNDGKYESQASLAGRSLNWQKSNMTFIEGLRALERIRKELSDVEYQAFRERFLDIMEDRLMPEDERRERLVDFINELKTIYKSNPTVGDALFSGIVNNYLSGITTMTTNIFSNALHIPILIFDRFGQAAIDSLLSPFNRGQRRVYFRESLEMLKSVGTFKGARRGMKPALQVLKHGKVISISEINSVEPYIFTKYRDEILHSTYNSIRKWLEQKGVRGDIASKIDASLTAASRFLVATDVMFKSIAAEADLRARVKNFSIQKNDPSIYSSFISNQGSVKRLKNQKEELRRLLLEDKADKKSILNRISDIDEEIRQIQNKSIDKIGKNNFKAMRREAVKFADHATFMDRPGNILKGFHDFRNTLPFQSGRILIPFMNTVTNIMKRAIERTPVLGLASPQGIIGSRVKRRRLERRLEQEKIGPVTAQRALQEMDREILGGVVKQIEGVAITALILSWFEDDKITGPAPKDAKERRQFYGQGKIPYAIKVGGKWVSYRWAEPLATAFGMISAFRTEINRLWDKEKPQEATDVFADLAESVKQVLFDSTWMRNLQDMMDARNLTESLLRVPPNLVPYSSLNRQVNAALDIAVEGKQVLNERGFLTDFIHNIPLGPLVAKHFNFNPSNPRLDVWGQEVDISSDVPMRWLGTFTHIDISEVSDDSVELELADLGVYPSMPYEDGFIRVNQKEVKIPEKVYANFMLQRGKLTKEILRKVIESPSYNRAKDRKSRVRIIEKALSKIQSGLQRRLLLSKMKEGVREALVQ